MSGPSPSGSGRGLLIEQLYLPIFPTFYDPPDSCPKFALSQLSRSLRNSYKNGSFRDCSEDDTFSSKFMGLIGAGKGKIGNSSNLHGIWSEVQELISANQILSTTWLPSGTAFLITLSDGTFIQFDLTDLWNGALPGEECSITIDRFPGLSLETVADATHSKHLGFFLYPDNKLTVARLFQKPNSKDTNPETVAENTIAADDFEIELETFPNLLPTLTPKRTDKHLIVHEDETKFIVWWSTKKDDVFPWTPKAEQRANVLMYSFDEEVKIKLQFFTKTESNLLGVQFVPKTTEILTLEETVDEIGSVKITETTYTYETNSKLSEVIIPLGSIQLTTWAYDKSKEKKLGLGTSDGSLILCYENGKITHCTRGLFIPQKIVWHPDGMILFVSGDRGQFQIFDLALNPMLLLDGSDPGTGPSLTLKSEPSIPIREAVWSEPIIGAGESRILLRTEANTLSFLRVLVGKMKLDNLVSYYMVSNKINEAITILRNVKWNSEECIYSFYEIFRPLILSQWSKEIESRLEDLFMTYYNCPQTQRDESIWKSHLSKVNTVAARYCCWLMQYCSNLERVFQIAKTLNNPGILIKLQKFCILYNDTELELQVTKYKESRSTHNVGDEAGESSGSYSSSSTHPTSCSTCSSSEDNSSESEENESHPNPESRQSTRGNDVDGHGIKQSHRHIRPKNELKHSERRIPSEANAKATSRQQNPVQSGSGENAKPSSSKSSSHITIVQLGQV